MTWQESLEATLPWHTARLRIRMSVPDDAAFVHAIGNHPDVRRFLGGPRGYSEADIRRGLTERTGWMDSLYIVETLADDKPIGETGILDLGRPEFGKDACDILIELLPEHQSKGYGRELLRELRHRWLTTLDHSYCTTTTRLGNEAAARLLAIEGFKHVGEFTDDRDNRQLVYKYEIL